MKTRRKASYDYTMPKALNEVASKYDIAANMALFLATNGKSIYSTWAGNMKAADQRAIFGAFLGKGTIYIDGENDAVFCMVTVCFGTDSEASVGLKIQDRQAWRNFYSIGEPSKREKEVQAICDLVTKF